ncbi:MAG: DNA polymerase III subunit alpha [Methylocystaceae bacterium]
MSGGFVHLHNHSEYSLLDGAARVKALVARAKEMGMPAVALTDHGVMYGVMDFYKEAIKVGIKPIIGCEVYVAPRSRLDKQARLDDSQNHLVLLARNLEGYRNLTELVSRAYLEGFYYKPRVDHELLERYCTGLIASSACLNGEIPELLLAGKSEEAEHRASYYHELYGDGNFYLEVQDHGIPEQKGVNEQLFTLGKKLSLPIIASNDVHYLYREDAFIQDVLLCIQTGKSVNDTNRMRFSGQEFYLKTAQEMGHLFPGHPEVLANTLQVASRCELTFDFSQFLLPRFITSDQETPANYLRRLAYAGLPQRYPNAGRDVTERLEYELGVIEQMGFCEYFLIVQDLVSWSKQHDIPVGPGRGSAAGSLVSYLLGITAIDPLQYGLIFERFLNPERVSMPDIDVDFCFEKRDRVIDYIVERYGQDRVAQIITFGTMAAKAAIRDVGRVLDYSYGEVDAIAKMVPQVLGMNLDKALESSKDLAQAYESRDEVRRLVDTARALEGMPRHASVHAAGVVIGPEPLTHILPLQKMVDGHVVTQFAKETVEEIGLLKMDILGLRTLTVIDRTLKLLANSRGVVIDLEQIPLADEAVYHLLSRADTTGVFQLESDGLRRILTEMKPSCFEDIIAVIALYRPGPLGSGMVEDFIERKHGRLAMEYAHPLLEPILRETYGVILYQEQVMSIAGRLAGFTMGEADSLRRAMGKKKPQEIARVRDKFVDGAALHAIEPALASSIFDLMESFAGYGFNKSHSAAYALISYQTAYLKAHYPVEYMCAFLSSVIDNQDRVTFYIKECQQAGIQILPPDINASQESFAVSNGAIRFGLGAIKNLGVAAVRSIMEARLAGSFASLFDFCSRVDARQLNKRSLENLVLGGAFDSLGMARKELLQILDPCVEMAGGMREALSNEQDSLFGLELQAQEEPQPRFKGEFDLEEKLRREKEVLGFYISGNPLDQYKQLLPFLISHELVNLNRADEGDTVNIVGMVTGVRRRVSKKGAPWASLELEDLTGKIEVVLFPEIYRGAAGILDKGVPLKIWGRIMHDNENIKVSALSLETLPTELSSLHLRLNGQVDKEEILQVLVKFPGSLPVCVHPVGGRSVVLKQFQVALSPRLNDYLNTLCGPENVWFE